MADQRTCCSTAHGAQRAGKQRTARHATDHGPHARAHLGIGRVGRAAAQCQGSAQQAGAGQGANGWGVDGDLL